MKENNNNNRSKGNNNNNRSAYDILSEFYDAFQGGNDAELVNIALAEIKERIPCELGGRRCRILDCGCGSGRVTLALLAADYAVSGVDISMEQLAIAEAKAFAFEDETWLKKYGGMPEEDDIDARLKARHYAFYCADLADLAMPEAAFDGAVCWLDTVNHLSVTKRNSFWHGLHTAVRPHGCLIFDYITDSYMRQNFLNQVYVDTSPKHYLGWQNDYVSGYNVATIDLFRRKSDGGYERFTTRIEEWALAADILSQELQANGWQVLADRPIGQDGRRLCVAERSDTV